MAAPLLRGGPTSASNLSHCNGSDDTRWHSNPRPVEYARALSRAVSRDGVVCSTTRT